jgi:hypothetical protein
MRAGNSGDVAMMAEGREAPTLMLMGNVIALDMIADIAEYVGTAGFAGFMEHINRRYPDGINGEPISDVAIRMNLHNLTAIVRDTVDGT